MSEGVRIAMWSGPRNISTAMMRSFGSRADCAVTDEPFYGAFLKDSGDPHPMATEIIEQMDCDWESVLATQSGAIPAGKRYWYQKHMPHHMIGAVSIRDMPRHRHAFMIRAPERVVASYRNKNELRSPAALGFARLREYFEWEADRLGAAPPVVDSDAILRDPTEVLGRLCNALAMEWDPAMLKWEKGLHSEDGIWGVHWYDKVNASTGFERSAGEMPDLEGDYLAVADACRADYEAVKKFAL